MKAMPNGMTQIKFTINTDTVSAFKARCASKGVSMASVISQFMNICRPDRSVKAKTGTRPLRKNAVLEVIALLDDIMQKESDYRDNIPEQFQSRYEAADHACEQLSQAIPSLEDAF